MVGETAGRQVGSVKQLEPCPLVPCPLLPAPHRLGTLQAPQPLPSGPSLASLHSHFTLGHKAWPPAWLGGSEGGMAAPAGLQKLPASPTLPHTLLQDKPTPQSWISPLKVKCDGGRGNTDLNSSKYSSYSSETGVSNSLSPMWPHGGVQGKSLVQNRSTDRPIHQIQCTGSVQCQCHIQHMPGPASCAACSTCTSSCHTHHI